MINVTPVKGTRKRTGKKHMIRHRTDRRGS